jgi:hypothetical protein
MPIDYWQKMPLNVMRPAAFDRVIFAFGEKLFDTQAQLATRFDATDSRVRTPFVWKRPLEFARRHLVVFQNFA